MAATDEIKARLSDHWIPIIYQELVRSGKTRRFEMAISERENSAEIQHTLLGIELKVGKQRLACPDLSTARYLRVFARLGCRSIAIPYDISQISRIADELDTAWHRIDIVFADMSTRNRRSLIAMIRTELNTLGSGEVMPQFDRVTKQRKPD
jgi:hypothetical protein